MNNKKKRNTRQHVIPIRFTAGEVETINGLAKQEHDYISGFLRRLILRWIDDYKTEDNKKQ